MIHNITTWKKHINEGMRFVLFFRSEIILCDYRNKKEYIFDGAGNKICETGALNAFYLNSTDSWSIMQFLATYTTKGYRIGVYTSGRVGINLPGEPLKFIIPPAKSNPGANVDLPGEIQKIISEYAETDIYDVFEQYFRSKLLL